jgi:hypothetical protein
MKNSTIKISNSRSHDDNEKERERIIMRSLKTSPLKISNSIYDIIKMLIRHGDMEDIGIR